MIGVSTRPPGGKGNIFTKSFFVLLSLSLVGLFFTAVRFTKGIGAVSNLSDGYPWGIWVAYDVAIGTAVTCGGYTVALLSYIINRGHYNTLVKSAILTSLFGSFLAASSIVVEIGRPWNAHGLLSATSWQPSSAFFELVLCLFGYLIALCLEYLPNLLALMGRGTPTAMRTLALNFLLRKGLVAWQPAGKGRCPVALPRLWTIINRVLICSATAGIILPTMHQSALGSLMLIASTKLHPLWHSPFLPLLFLINCIYFGYAIVIFVSVLSSFVLNRGFHDSQLAAVGRVIPWLTAAWLVIRIGDVMRRDHRGHGDRRFLLHLLPCRVFPYGHRRHPVFPRRRKALPSPSVHRRRGDALGGRVVPVQRLPDRVQSGQRLALLPFFRRSDDRRRHRFGGDTGVSVADQASATASGAAVAVLSIALPELFC
ncbi:NrfD/PsrC family molybdoenzyme membrane anchor subunit [Geomonas subterranea]|uniref:NrfD/PsrC family molybdoenzyme membrane anchor subunit n=1 Tax=Geomonas subterranea TaxID=2847989 RepID=UPI001EF11F04|nr:Ni/Fe-hydrogenase cytochrome b subunit [Geomonas subterranea]